MPEPTPASSPAAAPDPAPGNRLAFRWAVIGAVLILAVSAGFAFGRLTGRSTAGPGTATDPAVASGSSGDHAHGSAASAGSEPATAHAHGAPANGTGTDGTGTGTNGTGTNGTGTNGTGTGGTAADRVAAGGTAGDGSGGHGPAVGGLAVSAAGLTLVPQSTTFRAGVRQPLRFHIAGSAGAPITTFAVVHDKPLHLIVVRRDLSGYRHLHPSMAADGTWSVELTLPAAGTWRAYADFTAIVGGRQIPVTLGVDLTVPGDYRPVPLPAADDRAATRDLSVRQAGAPRVGVTQPLLFHVDTAAGTPAPVEPYLGAYGHLIMLREGDLGYVHVHPEPQLVDGAVKFWVAAPGPGRYRMFLDVQVAGTVHTAGFTATVPAG